MSIYDDSLNDHHAHPHVIKAREAGRAWAEREAESCSDLAGSSGSWYPTDRDAIPLVSFEPSSDVEDQYERELELAKICNAAAHERWEELVAAAERLEELVAAAAASDPRVQARADGYEVIGRSSPDWWRYRPADADELRERLSELRADTSADSIVRENIEREIPVYEEVLAALDRGVAVRVALDEDGLWVAYPTESAP